VADEDDREPVGDEAPQSREQGLDLLRHEHGGRLVEDEDPAVPGQRLHDLDTLLLADRQIPDARPRIDADAVPSRGIGYMPPCRSLVESEAGPTERKVLGDRHRADEREVLGHHPDPGADRHSWRGHRDRAAVDADLPRVGSGQPIQDAHQRRLAGAVLPEKGMDLPAADREIDPVVGNEAPEPLGDPPELDDRLRVRRDHVGVSWRGRSPRAGLPR
jgi:hypothetical protein